MAVAPAFSRAVSAWLAFSMPLPLLILLAQLAIPGPRGYVNDFAGVLDPATVSRLEATIREVREKTGAEIAVVTLPDIGDRPAVEIATRIGREWGVGDLGEAGDRTKNLGVVVLVVPQRDHRRGTGHVFIATGRGAEGILPDSRVGRIRDAMIPALAQEQYAEGLTTGIALLAQALAAEFGVALDSVNALAPRAGEPRSLPTRGIPLGWIILLVVLIIMLSRRGRSRRAWSRRRGMSVWPFIFGSGGWGRGGWGGGGGGGGFGGFGGGGGFSGGGAGGRF